MCNILSFFFQSFYFNTRSRYDPHRPSPFPSQLCHGCILQSDLRKSRSLLQYSTSTWGSEKKYRHVKWRSAFFLWSLFQPHEISVHWVRKKRCGVWKWRNFTHLPTGYLQGSDEYCEDLNPFENFTSLIRRVRNIIFWLRRIMLKTKISFN